MTFSPRIQITNSDFLFGRKLLLNQLVALANNRYSVSITGLRRFGKTCILKCLENSLKQDAQSKVYPVYFDFKEVGSIIKGTDNVYRYMVSCLVVRLFQDRYFTEAVSFKNKIIKPASDWEDIFENLYDVNAARIQGLFEDIIVFFQNI